MFYRSTFTGTVQDREVFTITALSCSKRNVFEFHENGQGFKAVAVVRKIIKTDQWLLAQKIPKCTLEKTASDSLGAFGSSFGILIENRH